MPAVLFQQQAENSPDPMERLNNPLAVPLRLYSAIQLRRTFDHTNFWE
ncbi:hypothetical protein [Anatilimnocola aggregata]|nr:hypothetical protein [Anatilimnocola aggregata]